MAAFCGFTLLFLLERPQNGESVSPTPLGTELESVFSFLILSSALIEDARFFLTPPFVDISPIWNGSTGTPFSKIVCFPFFIIPDISFLSSILITPLELSFTAVCDTASLLLLYKSSES
eukprot:Pompholyxophrys_punicea_v1_NODE_56_length_4190_cov_12.775333.p5 type:complete len:119 gc:universal NODE_56_length_4190_cov_12.775333:3797-3441(-)